jgi:hypothetical protein
MKADLHGETPACYGLSCVAVSRLTSRSICKWVVAFDLSGALVTGGSQLSLFLELYEEHFYGRLWQMQPSRAVLHQPTMLLTQGALGSCPLEIQKAAMWHTSYACLYISHNGSVCTEIYGMEVRVRVQGRGNILSSSYRSLRIWNSPSLLKSTERSLPGSTLVKAWRQLLTSFCEVKNSGEWCLLGCYAVWLLNEPTFRRNLVPPSSGWQTSVN